MSDSRKSASPQNGQNATALPDGQDAPEQAAPEQGVPEQGVPEQGVPEQAAIATVTGLHKFWDSKDGPVHAVRDVSFSVRPGEILGLLGGNGAGKTTTISMLLGILLPSQGHISLFGLDMPRHRYQALAWMNFSSPYVDLPYRLTVRENLDVYARLYNVAGVRQRLAELVEELELGDFLNRPTGRLSAGQKTRVALAKALVNWPRFLLLDEPTASLDPDSADRIRTALERYCRSGTAAEGEAPAILLASHNMAEVERLCGRVLMMRQGQIVDEDSPAALVERYGRRNLEEVFLDIARAGREGGGKGEPE